MGSAAFLELKLPDEPRYLVPFAFEPPVPVAEVLLHGLTGWRDDFPVTGIGECHHRRNAVPGDDRRVVVFSQRPTHPRSRLTGPPRDLSALGTSVPRGTLIPRFVFQEGIPDLRFALRDIDPVQGEEDMALLKRELGETKTLMGGINCDVLLANANREQVDHLVTETIDLMAPGGHFIMHLVPGVYAGVPWEKVRWLIEDWKQHA